MNRLYADNRGLIGLWVRRYAPLCSAVCAPEDLEQAGFLGLVEAAKTWDPTKGAWSTWASYYIRKAMQDALGVYRKTIKAVSLDTPLLDEEGAATIGDMIEDKSLPPIGEAIERMETVRAVRQAVEEIEDTEVREAIGCVYLRGMDHRAAAEALGIPVGRVGTLIRKGWRLLFNNDRLREAALDEETKFHAHKSVTAFMRDHTSVVEAAVIWRDGRRGHIN